MQEAITTTDAPQREPATGSTLAGRFVLRDLLGEGSTSRVYRADDLQAGGQVALKVLLARHRGQALEYRLLDEGEYLRRIGAAKHVVRLIECGQAADHDDWPFVALELLAGRTLREHALPPNSLSTALVVSHARQIVAALGECHRANVVHRDVTPANVMVIGDPRTSACKLRLFDFSHAGASNGPRLPPGHPDRLTTEFELVGTPRYIPPEQARANPAVAAMDVFALGVVLWELLVGDNPFAAIVEPGEFVAKQRRGGVPVPRLEASPRIPDTLARLVNDCLVHEAKLRPSLAAVAERLDHLHAELSRAWQRADDGDRTDAISPEELARYLAEVGAEAPTTDTPATPTKPPAKGRDKTDAISPEVLARARSGVHAAASDHTAAISPETLARTREAAASDHTAAISPESLARAREAAASDHTSDVAPETLARPSEAAPPPASRAQLAAGDRTDALSPEALDRARSESASPLPSAEPVLAFAREDAPPVILPELPEPLVDDDDDLASLTPSRRWLPITLVVVCLGLLGAWWFTSRDDADAVAAKDGGEPPPSDAPAASAAALPSEPGPSEPEPTEPSEPAEPEPSEPEPDEPAESDTKSGTKAGQPNHRSPECADVRDDAAAALASKQWDKAERLARRSSCWSSSVERLRIRVRALAESEHYADCVRVGGDHSDKEIQKWVNICRRAQ
jgi:serine/threonine-protein kinase